MFTKNSGFGEAILPTARIKGSVFLKGLLIISFIIPWLITLTSCGLNNISSAPGYFSVYVGEPRRPLIPGNTTETEGNAVIAALFTPLVNFDKKGNILYNGVAKSITSSDSQHWIIKLKPNWTFHDGTKVTAKSYVDAWNYNALSKHAYSTSSFFNGIQGYEDLQGANPKSTQMSGLKVIDDTTFSVSLIASRITFPLALYYCAFYPLPASFYKDPKKFGEFPIGNGPFQAETKWTVGQGIKLKRYPKYVGENKAQSKGIEFKVYSSIDTAYLDVQAGVLDFLRTIPDSAIDSYKMDFPQNFLRYKTGATEAIAFPLYDQRFADKRVRQAFSLAIDRKNIIKNIFEDTGDPLTDFVPPAVPGYKEYGCAYCRFDPVKARALLKEAKFDTHQTVDYWFNAGAGNDTWMLAVANQIKQNLGINYRIRGDLQFSQYLPKMQAKGMSGGIYRSSWIMDYPGIDNFYSQVYSAKALPPKGANYSFYNNPQFDILLDKGLAAHDQREYFEYLAQAREIISEDIPVMPIFYKTNVAIWSNKISEVYVDPQQTLNYADVKVN